MSSITITIFDLTNREIREENFDSSRDYHRKARVREEIVADYFESKDYIALRNTSSTTALEKNLSNRDLFALKSYFDEQLEKIFCRGVPDVFAFKYRENANPNNPVSNDIEDAVFIEEKSRGNSLSALQMRWFCEHPEKRMYMSRVSESE